MGKDAKEETVTESTQRIDPASQAYLDQVRQQAQDASAATLAGGPLTAGLGDEFQSGVDAMNRFADPDFVKNLVEGVGSASGGGVNFDLENLDLDRIQEFLNPFLEEVVGGVQRDTDVQREAVQTRAASAATAAKAFGGSRAQLLETQGLADVNRDELRQLGQLRFQGFESARGAALQEHLTLQGLGMQGAIASASNRTNASIASLQSRTQLGVAGSGLGLQAAGGLVGAGVTRQQVETQQLRDDLLKQTAALGFTGSALGPVGQDVSGTSTKTSSPGFDPFSFVGGLGVTALSGGLFSSGGAPGVSTQAPAPITGIQPPWVNPGSAPQGWMG